MMSFEMNRPRTYEGSSSYVGWMRSMLVYEYSLASPASRSSPNAGRRGPACLDWSVLHSTWRFLLCQLDECCVCALEFAKALLRRLEASRGCFHKCWVDRWSWIFCGERSSDLAALQHIVTYCQSCHVFVQPGLGEQRRSLCRLSA
jgi:hypothetical protein